MPGKTRPSLMNKVLQNVKTSNLSETDKKCIVEVFERFVPVVRCRDCPNEYCCSLTQYLGENGYCSKADFYNFEKRGDV